MSFKDCVTRAIENGELDPERGGRALVAYDESIDPNVAKLGQVAGDVKTARQVFDAMQFQKREKKRVAALMVEIGRQRQMDIKSFVDSNGQNDLAAGYRALYERHSNADYTNVAATHDEINARTNSIINEVLTEFRLTTTGDARNTTGFRKVVHELFGDIDTGDAQAKNMAKAVSTAQEYLRQRFNAAGGRIPKKVGFGMTQKHDKKSLIDAGQEEWSKAISDGLAPEKMINPDTGLPIKPSELDKAIKNAWVDITRNKLNRESPDVFLGQKSKANSRLDHRFFVFKDSEAWLKYSERFGDGDPFSQLMSHMDGLARDISMMETFGPNPLAMKGFLEERVMFWASDLAANKIKRKGWGSGNWEGHAKSVLRQTKNMDDLFTGVANSPVDEFHANTSSFLQAGHVAAVLGSAFLSSISDVATTFLTAGAADLPMFKILKNTASNFTGLNRVDRIRLSARLSLILDNQNAVANGQMRYVGEVMGPQVMRRISHTVLNLSLLSPWTKSWRWGFGQTFLGELHDATKKSWEQLLPGQRETMERYGINQNDWLSIRKTKPYDASIDFNNMKSSEGTKFFDIRGLSERSDLSRTFARDLANKMSRMVTGETEFAVPSTTLRGRAILTQGHRPGTIAGTAWRSFAMYKSYMSTLMLTHFERAYSQGTPLKRTKEFAKLFLATTATGAIAVQLKDISKGRDPRQMFDENGIPDAKFLGAAITQGGGLGIFGDLFFSDSNRFGGGLMDTFSGPGAGFIDDIGKFTIGNIQELVAGEDTKAGREFTNLIKRYTPGQSLWYSRLALERLIFDQIQEELDPKASKSFATRERNMRRDYDQEFWWRPGKTSPGRSPDFSEIVN
jgi:hypothetical protein